MALISATLGPRALRAPHDMPAAFVPLAQERPGRWSRYSSRPCRIWTAARLGAGGGPLASPSPAFRLAWRPWEPASGLATIGTGHAGAPLSGAARHGRRTGTVRI
jgi:hypothetical protein